MAVSGVIMQAEEEAGFIIAAAPEIQEILHAELKFEEESKLLSPNI